MRCATCSRKSSSELTCILASLSPGQDARRTRYLAVRRANESAHASHHALDKTRRRSAGHRPPRVQVNARRDSCRPGEAASDKSAGQEYLLFAPGQPCPDPEDAVGEGVRRGSEIRDDEPSRGHGDEPRFPYVELPTTSEPQAASHGGGEARDPAKGGQHSEFGRVGEEDVMRTIDDGEWAIRGLPVELRMLWERRPAEAQEWASVRHALGGRIRVQPIPYGQ